MCPWVYSTHSRLSHTSYHAVPRNLVEAAQYHDREPKMAKLSSRRGLSHTV